MNWGSIIETACNLVGIFVSDKVRRDKLKLQMYEFAKKFDHDAIEGNEKIRQEIIRMKTELGKTDEPR